MGSTPMIMQLNRNANNRGTCQTSSYVIVSVNAPKTFSDLYWFATQKYDHCPSNSPLNEPCYWNESTLHLLLQHKLETKALHNPGRLYFPLPNNGTPPNQIVFLRGRGDFFMTAWFIEKPSAHITTPWHYNHSQFSPSVWIMPSERGC